MHPFLCNMYRHIIKEANYKRWEQDMWDIQRGLNISVRFLCESLLCDNTIAKQTCLNCCGREGNSRSLVWPFFFCDRLLQLGLACSEWIYALFLSRPSPGPTLGHCVFQLGHIRKFLFGLVPSFTHNATHFRSYSSRMNFQAMSALRHQQRLIPQRYTAVWHDLSYVVTSRQPC